MLKKMGGKNHKTRVFWPEFIISSCVKSPRSILWHWMFWNKLKCIRDDKDCHFANVQCCVFQKYFSQRLFNWEAKVQITVIQIRLCIFDYRNVHFQHGTHRIKCTATKTVNENCMVNLVPQWIYIYPFLLNIFN